MDLNWNTIFGIAGFSLLLAGILSTWSQMRARDRRHRRMLVREGRAIGTRMPVRREERRFRRQFPELQPYFHPEKVILFVREQKRFKPRRPEALRRRFFPNGFNSWWLVTEDPSAKVLRMELRSVFNTVKAAFTYEATSGGATLRIGEGEMDVSVGDPNPHVRYRHPRHEFRWTAKKGWTVGRASLDRFEPERVDHGYGDDAPGSAGRESAVAAAGAALVAGGGSFDGGGASQGWDSSRADATEGSWESAAGGDDAGDDSDSDSSN